MGTNDKRRESMDKLCDVLVYMTEWIERQDEEERTGIVTGSRYDREREQMRRFRRMCEEYREIRTDVLEAMCDYRDRLNAED